MRAQSIPSTPKSPRPSQAPAEDKPIPRGRPEFASTQGSQVLELLRKTGTAPFLEAALELARKWSVFPVKARAKKPPLTKHGLKDATRDPNTIRQWWTKWPSANIAIALGPNVAVIDSDPRHGGDKSLQELEAEYGLLPVTLTVRTGGGGQQFYFLTNGVPLRNSAGKLGPGLDVKTDGGYVMAPPSMHPSGKPYELIHDGPIAPLPKWIEEKLLAPAPLPRSGDDGRQATILQGRRNATLTSMAGTMRRSGMCESAILAALIEHNSECCEPRLAEHEVRTIARSVSRYPAGAAQQHEGTSEETVQLPPRFSEETLALRFSAKHGDDLRYVAGWGRWLRWDGACWRQDNTLQVFDLARIICREAAAECKIEKPNAAPRLAAAATVAAVERLARADRRHAAIVEQWDADPWLLNTHNGTIELRAGEQREHRRHDYFTKVTGAGFASESEDCPLWLRFLDRTTGGDPGLQAFLQRMIGYCLTGSIREHALFFLHGTGANGKTVFISTVAAVLGDYAKTAAISTFMATGSEQHPTDLAGLRGARLVTAIETEDGRRWAEAKIKALTGGDRISARFMRQDFFEYTPQFKLLIAGNHKPGLRSVDEAIRRRLHLIPFNVTIPAEERDTTLVEKLRSEYPSILRWAVEGCQQWQRTGLKPPAPVLDATAEYLSGEDRLGQWIEERCDVGNTYSAAARDLYQCWKLWCESAGEKPGSQKRFSQNLESHGFERDRKSNARLFKGLAPKGGL